MLGWWNWLSAAVVAGLAVVTAWLRQQDPIILFVIGLCTFAAMVIIFERLAARRHRIRSTAPQKTGEPERNDHWTERKQLEIYVLANASGGVDPIALPVDKDPQLTRLRELKDAITRDELDATLNGERPNVMSTVTLQSFEQYVAATNKQYWQEVLHRWQARQRRESDNDSQVPISSRISLIDLAKEAEKRGWKMVDPNSLHVLDFFDAVRQLGVDGKITAYGRPAQTFKDMARTEPLIPILPEQWRNHEIDVFTFFQWQNGQQHDYVEDNFETNLKCLPETGAIPRYFDIHLDRDDALIWLDSEAIHFRGRRTE